MAVLDIMTLLGIIITEMYKTFKILDLLSSTSSKIDQFKLYFQNFLLVSLHSIVLPRVPSTEW